MVQKMITTLFMKVTFLNLLSDFYSMYAVRQERFLEGFDEVPEQKKT